jgi:uncharacterized protein (DUF849 family)
MVSARFEDITLLPDGTEARDNAALVAAAARMIRAHVEGGAQSRAGDSGS